ncbi:MAG: hypothetical protein ACLFV7_02530 [Phycisphaerae bacterium]
MINAARHLDGLLAQATYATDRWNAAHKGLFQAANWPVFAIALVLLGGTIFGLWYLVKRYNRNQAWAEFTRLCEAHGLREPERSVLEFMLDVAGIDYPPLVFDRGAFEEASAAVTNSEQFASIPAASRKSIEAQLRLIREKLSFTRAPIAAAPSTRQTQVGAGVTVMTDPEKPEIVGRLAGNTENRLIVQLAQAAVLREGQVVIVRYNHQGVVWEFDSRVISFAEGNVYLDHSEKIRPINRRSFPRIPVRMPANVAVLPYLQHGLNAQPQFVDGVLVELAGPGFVLRAPLEVRVNERILVNVGLRDEKIIEGVGRVVRVAPVDEEGTQEIVTEMMGLTESEVADLTCETNRAARSNDNRFRTPVGEEATTESDA